MNGTYGKAGDDVVEVAVLEVELVDAAPEHFTVGRMYYRSIPANRRSMVCITEVHSPETVARDLRPAGPGGAAIVGAEYRSGKPDNNPGAGAGEGDRMNVQPRRDRPD